MQCFGGSIPSGSNTNDITASWTDGGNTMQSATSLPYSALTLSATPAITTTLSFSKRFSNAGNKALYSFTLTTATAVTANARFYFTFHTALSSFLDHEGVVECYIRTTPTINDATAQYTYCSFNGPWELIVWNNQNFASNTAIYIDIYNIDQPKNSDIGASQYIGVVVDSDSSYSNGVLAKAEVVDTAPSSTIATDFYILSTNVVGTFILTTQTVTITIDLRSAIVFSATNPLYVLFPAAYSQWITRGSTISTTYPASASNSYC